MSSGCTAPAGASGLFDGARTLASDMLRGFGTTLVVAPHPDDESLGCGGLIALLRNAGQPVWALLVTDGATSHPRSRRFDAAALGALRSTEWQSALACLGVPPQRLLRLGLPDGGVPARGAPAFDSAVQQLRVHLQHVAPATVVLPWRRDPHPDHAGTHALLRAALAGGSAGPCQLEYMVWMNERASSADWPAPGEVVTWRLDIRSVVHRKRQAIGCHRSQLGGVIDDDPTGFVIAPAMRARAEAPVEHFFEAQENH